MASAQILNFAWREGISADEVKPFAEEALRYARSSDKMHEPLVIGAYGRVLASTGAADDYVNLVQNAVKLTSEEGDVGRYATVNAMLAQAYLLSGRVREALAAADTAHEAITRQSGFDSDVTLGLNPNQIMGFDVEYWIRCLKARILLQLGQFGELETHLSELLATPSEQLAPVVRFIPHFAAIEFARSRGRAEDAAMHSAELHQIAESSGIPYLRVQALAGAGIARATAGDVTHAAYDFREAIEYSRRAKAGLEFEARMLGYLAEALYHAGDMQAAFDISGEAISVSRRRTDRVGELHATLLRCMIRASNSDLRNDAEASQSLLDAERLLEVSGAEIYKPMLIECRSYLEGTK